MRINELTISEFNLLKQEILEHQKRREQLFIITTTALGVVWAFILGLVPSNNVDVLKNALLFGLSSFAPYIIIIIFCRGVLINSAHIICMGTYIRHFIENNYKDALHWESVWDKFAQVPTDERKSKGYWYTFYLLTTLGTSLCAICIGFYIVYLTPLKPFKLHGIIILIIFSLIHIFLCFYCIKYFVKKIHWGRMNNEAREKWNDRWKSYINGKTIISNKKIAGLTPKWAAFKGFSLLFDNPNNNLVPLKENSDFKKIHCDCSLTELELYKLISESLSYIIDELSNKYLFFRLPKESYHVTVLDGLNDDNIGKLSQMQKKAGEDFLNCLPTSLETSSLFNRIINDLPFIIEMKHQLSFKFNKLAVWGNNVLVACLVPVDEKSEKYFNQLKKDRLQLLRKFKDVYGIQVSSSNYIPHVSLGYFANREFAKLDSSKLEDWTLNFKKYIGCKNLSFNSISLYGFTDMVTFFKF